MGDRQIIEELCVIIEKQSHIIRGQASALSQVGAICMEDEIRAVNDMANRMIGVQCTEAED